jgi:hypothetical protein
MTYSHLWNDMRIEERARLHPYMIETHILHLQQEPTIRSSEGRGITHVCLT